MKSVLITGVSSGIGYDAVRYFLQNAYRVFGSVRREEDAVRLRALFPDSFHPLVFDVTQPQAIDRAKTEVENILQGSGLDVLINNAGISVNGPIALVSPAAFRRVFDVNVQGLLAVTQAFLPLLGFGVDSKRPPGRIINVGSGAGRLTQPFMGPYAASKHAVEALSDALRRELVTLGIKVVLIEPATIKTAIFEKARQEKNPYKGTLYERVYDKLDTIVAQKVSKALPVEEVSRVLYKAAVHPNPKTRYVVASTKVKCLFWLATRVLSDKALDRVFVKQLAQSLSKN